MEVKIIRSQNRRKTISARLVNNIIQVNAPAGMSEEKLAEAAAKLKERIEKRLQKRGLASPADLYAVAQKLNQKYFGGELKIESIEYSTNQNSVHGSCSYKKRTIRISHRLAGMPEWVRDYVIVHELAHIIEPNHSSSFWQLVNRYELSERARGFLMGVGHHA
ncbi:hypothetical protein A2276_01375 [candidate division WOR-1 bacterium RIFOXYA12_FULL_43_27]|uniref:YgjP-like metallopeptidase domain-containing protein n=1 Tax=candidate division WOR-1 bacterium RIFOXYC2_FULL_46_14 TaxID=1802587 RepID=A0A1F4U4W0_UNCSA|nr:MAG: hypothetical protein A2276_01375 [candidate division WOR-1 bacterium RIFOXYA12_FULL_43_27]OGC20663.1 MAG: hypothetical protein A2292_06500 [candidate division WOR-1 bacterium RIFOXYB2_FULL_46_45]OGC31600.1 MAG: hypothetical protein A2232_04950 [candidate division WOR-1 bacterium RIFOXYA2_FULL_46_56]OGC40005.1 MAG: hypothetical protein A2438_05795 [candidate division WOR-1 bacterium RIFOXYC2_FULL_46_14]